MAATPDGPLAGASETLTLLQQFSRTFNELQHMFERHMGMSRARWHMLMQLTREEWLSQTALQQRLRVDGAAVTRQVKQLEEDGLVTRCAAPQDNRITLVSLTPAGHRLVEELWPRRHAFEALVTAGLTEAEIATLRSCLARMRDNLRQLDERSVGDADQHQ